MRLNLVWNPDICSSENRKYVRSISDDLVTTCDEIIYATKNISTKNVPTKTLSTNYFKKFLYFTRLFHSVIHSCSYLLLLDKASSKR